MSENPRILVVDDDTFLRMLVSVEIPDAELLEASRADEAYEIARREKPDAVLLDLRLPDGDGIDLLRKLRQTPPLAQTPILVITAGHDEAHRTEMLKAGADEYLAKPIEGVDLQARLDRILAVPPDERRQRRQEMLDRLDGGLDGDPDPVPHDSGEEPETPRRRWFRRS